MIFMSRTIVIPLLNKVAAVTLGLMLLASAPASASGYFDANVVGQALSSRLPAGWQPIPASAAPARPMLDEAALSYALKPLFPAVWMQAAAPATGSCPDILQHAFNLLQTGENQSLCQYQGKVLLIVNTASFCGYTTQYEGLEALYRKYKDRGLVVVGFPSNDFGGQEPGSNKEIAEFCRTTYGVQFPLYEKTTVSNLSANALYAQLAKATGEKPKWNFHKYVVDRDGRTIASFGSGVTPDKRELLAVIERALAQKPAPAKG
jgi:glutathione peroxidase